MYDYQKKIAQMEKKVPYFSYKVSVFPKTKNGAYCFHRNEKKMDSFTMELTWYYNDPKETEKEQVAIAESKIQGFLSNKKVLGITHTDSTEKTLFKINLLEGGYERPVYKKDWDYTLERIDHETAAGLTLDDIPILEEV